MILNTNYNMPILCVVKPRNTTIKARDTHENSTGTPGTFTYTHVAPGLQEAAAKRFDEAIQVGHNNNVSEKV